MLIMSVTNPKGEEKFIAAAFPSACGKTNLAMITPTIPGYTVRCVGDDIAWMRFDKEQVNYVQLILKRDFLVLHRKCSLLIKNNYIFLIF